MPLLAHGHVVLCKGMHYTVVVPTAVSEQPASSGRCMQGTAPGLVVCHPTTFPHQGNIGHIVTATSRENECWLGCTIMPSLRWRVLEPSPRMAQDCRECHSGAFQCLGLLSMCTIGNLREEVTCTVSMSTAWLLQIPSYVCPFLFVISTVQLRHRCAQGSYSKAGLHGVLA